MGSRLFTLIAAASLTGVPVQAVDFNREVRPIISELRLDLREVNDEEPKLAMPTAEESARTASFQRAITELESRTQGSTPEFEAELRAWEADAMRPVPWQPLSPAAVAAKHGSTLTILEDHSIRADGLAPPSEICTIRVNERLTGITAFRLEALPDDSLPKRGPGRGADGNATVTDFKIQIVPKATKRTPDGVRTVALKDASADFFASGFPPSMAIDSDPEKTGWSFAGSAGTAHAAVFQTSQPITVPPDAELLVSIGQSSGKNETLGHFRVSVTTAPAPVRELDAKIRAILALEPSERDPAQREALANYFRPLSKTAR